LYSGKSSHTWLGGAQEKRLVPTEAEIMGYVD
jgi:hypothetical protein